MRTCSLALLLTLVAALPAAGHALYGSEWNGSALYEIDPLAGSFVTVGDPPPTNLPGLAYDPTTETMYATDLNNLYTVDLATAATTLVGSFGVATTLTGLTFDTTYTALFLIGFDGNLYSANPNTGAATLIGALGAAPNTIVDLATASDDTLHGIDTSSDRLMTLDTGTRVATFIGAASIGNDVRGLAYVPQAIGDAGIPTLGLLGVILLTVLLAATGWLAIRR